MVWSEMSGGREGVESSTPSSERMEPSRSARFALVEPQARGYRTIYCNDREANDSVRFKGNSVSTTKYNVLTFLPKGLYEQELHWHSPEESSRELLLEFENRLRRVAISRLPRETSRHTGFAFDSPGYESFFASQFGVYAPQKAWDVVRRASARSSRAKK